MFRERTPEDVYEEKELINKAEEIAEKVLVKDTINEKDFEDLYSEEAVKNDLEEVRSWEKKFEEEDTFEQKEARRLARIFESIIYDQGERALWFGESAQTIKTSRYDDIKNGIDLIVEFLKDESHSSLLALAVDVTLTSDAEKIREKLEKIKKNIDKGRMGTIKYFKSETFSLRGEKTNVPKVVIGVDYRTFIEVIDLWTQSFLQKSTANAHKKLAEHHIQFILLNEISLQLEEFKKYAQKKNQNKIVEEYEKMEKIISGIFDEKLNLYQKVYEEKSSAIEENEAYKAIERCLEDLFKKEK